MFVVSVLRGEKAGNRERHCAPGSCRSLSCVFPRALHLSLLFIQRTLLSSVAHPGWILGVPFCCMIERGDSGSRNSRLASTVADCGKVLLDSDVCVLDRGLLYPKTTPVDG